MASAVDSRLAYARLSAVATASRLPTANRGSNNSYTTSWDTTAEIFSRAMDLDANARRPSHCIEFFDTNHGLFDAVVGKA